MGRNDSSDEPSTSSWLLEANCETGGRSTLFGRAERVEKTGRDLALPSGLESEVFAIRSLVAGYVFRIVGSRTMVLGAGARISVDFIANELEPFYGTRHPGGYMIFLQIHPPEMKGHSMKM